MPQQTEVSANPPAEKQPPAETHSASPPPAPAESYFKLHPRAPMILVIVALVLLVGGYFTFRYFSMYESTDDAEVDGHLMPLSARITGYVIKVNVDDNQYVDAGTVLAEIDPRDYQVALDQANASLADAQATAQALNINVPIASVNSDSQVSATEADVENARAGISVAQDQYTAAKAQLDRSRSQRRQSAKRPAALQTARGEAGNLAAAVRPGRRRRQSQQCGGRISPCLRHCGRAASNPGA